MKALAHIQKTQSEENFAIAPLLLNNYYKHPLKILLKLVKLRRKMSFKTIADQSILGISKKQLLKSSRQDHIIGHFLVLGPDILFNLDQMLQNSLTVNTINEYTGNLQIFDELETEDPIYFRDL